MKPFADDKASMSIGELTVENSTTTITMSGSLEVGRDKQGLKRAQALKAMADQLVQALEAAGDLPDRVQAAAKTSDAIANPFA